MAINLENMSDDEIGALATQALDSLSLAEKVQAVLKAFHSKEERDELVEWLNDQPEEEEGEEDDL